MHARGAGVFPSDSWIAIETVVVAVIVTLTLTVFNVLTVTDSSSST